MSSANPPSSVPITDSEPAPARRGIIKSFLPRTLFGRALLILVMPLLLVQIVATWVFYDRLWDTITRRMADSVAGDIRLVLDSGQDFTRPDGKHFLAMVGTSAELEFRFEPGVSLAERWANGNSLSHSWLGSFPGESIATPLANALTRQIQTPFRLGATRHARTILVAFAVNGGVLEVAVPRDRLWSSTTYIFLMWMVGTALVTFGLATIFLRNQTRSLRRLAIAAEAFGKGRDVPHFRVEGAAEVRQADAAFLRMRERIQRQITQRTEMLAGVSHDLRTPLTRMKIELELLGDAEEIRELKSDVSEMERMVEGYLDFARGEGSEVPQVIDLMELLRMVAANARRAGADVELTGPVEMHVKIRRDAFARCVTNLVSNAARHGEHVVLTAVPSRLYVEIFVDDDGPGIPESLREAVFRPFFRAESSRNRATGGIGLGLTIARDILRGQGGDITLLSSPQGGLRARIKLPR